MEELPNGFLNYPKKRPDFESAGDAIRKAEIEARYGRDKLDVRQSQKQALNDGWRVQPEDDLGLFRKKPQENVWGADDVYNPKDLLNYLDIPDVSSDEQAPVFNYAKLSEIPEKDRRWSWVNIDLGAIHRNVMSIKRMLKPSTLFMAVVKANGYGHGAVPCAKTALNSGADYLGVATVDEGIELREAGLHAPILVLSEPPISSIPLLLAYRIMPAVSTAEFAIKYADAANSVGMLAPYHLKVNTGMNRVGVRFDAVMDFLREVSFHRALQLVGTFTHFATADSPDTMDFNLQRQRFENVLDTMRAAHIDPGIVHAANSAATLRYPEVQYDMVRPGIAMYGHYPCPETYNLIDLVPAMSVHARITQVTQVPVGEGVSYGLLHRSSGFAKTCTIPIGYADGLKRALSGRISFIMEGQLHPQVGSICMDQCMFEVDMRTRSGIGKIDPHVGDEVVVVGRQGNSVITIDDMAEMLNLISYELLMSFGESRLPKYYV